MHWHVSQFNRRNDNQNKEKSKCIFISRMRSGSQTGWCVVSIAIEHRCWLHRHHFFSRDAHHQSVRQSVKANTLSHLACTMHPGTNARASKECIYTYTYYIRGIHLQKSHWNERMNARICRSMEDMRTRNSSDLEHVNKFLSTMTRPGRWSI